MDGGEEISCGFVIARGDSPELFEFAEEILDQVACLVKFRGKFARCPAVASTLLSSYAYWYHPHHPSVSRDNGVDELTGGRTQ